MIKYLLALSIISMISCSGTAPAVSSFMNDNSHITLSYLTKSGDLEQEPRGFDEYYDELNNSIDVGAFLNIKKLSYGVTFGNSGVTPVLGIKNKYIGAMSWFNFDLSMVSMFTCGLALTQQVPIQDWFSLGIYEYIDRNSIPSFENGELFRSPVSSKQFGEYGAGIYSSISIMNKIGTSVEFKKGYELKSKSERYYVHVSASYLFGKEQVSKSNDSLNHYNFPKRKYKGVVSKSQNDSNEINND